MPARTGSAMLKKQGTQADTVVDDWEYKSASAWYPVLRTIIRDDRLLPPWHMIIGVLSGSLMLVTSVLSRL